jgi:hypothetical protein
LAAQLPSAPSFVQTIAEQAEIMFNWDAPYDGASPIQSYSITIRHSDEVSFTPNLDYCDG